MAGCALLEARLPASRLLGPDEYDIAGAGTGVVEADELLSSDRVRPGDVLVAMASSGAALQRLLTCQACVPRAGRLVARPSGGRVRSKPGEELLVPTDLRPGHARSPRCSGRAPARAFAHHRRRCGSEYRAGAPEDLAVDVERGTWTLLPSSRPSGNWAVLSATTSSRPSTWA